MHQQLGHIMTDRKYEERASKMSINTKKKEKKEKKKKKKLTCS